MSLLNTLCTSTNPVALVVHRVQWDISGVESDESNSNGNYGSISPHLPLNRDSLAGWVNTGIHRGESWEEKRCYTLLQDELREDLYFAKARLWFVIDLRGTFFTSVSGCAAVHLERYITKSTWFMIWFDPAVLTERSRELCLNKEGKLGFLFLNGLWKQIRDQQLPRWKVYCCQIFSTFHLNYLVLVSIRVFN